MNFVGKPVAFVGRIDRFEDNTMYMKTHEGKWQNIFLTIWDLAAFRETDFKLWGLIWADPAFTWSNTSI